MTELKNVTKKNEKYPFLKNKVLDQSNIFLNRLKWKDKKNLLVDTNIGPGQEFILDAQKAPEISAWAESLIRDQLR